MRAAALALCFVFVCVCTKKHQSTQLDSHAHTCPSPSSRLLPLSTGDCASANLFGRPGGLGSGAGPPGPKFCESSVDTHTCTGLLGRFDCPRVLLAWPPPAQPQPTPCSISWGDTGGTAPAALPFAGRLRGGARDARAFLFLCRACRGRGRSIPAKEAPPPRPFEGHAD